LRHHHCEQSEAIQRRLRQPFRLGSLMLQRMLGQELDPDLRVRAPADPASTRRMSAGREQKQERIRKQMRRFDAKLCAELGYIDNPAIEDGAADVDPGGNVHLMTRNPAALLARLLQDAPRRELLGIRPVHVAGHLDLLCRRQPLLRRLNGSRFRAV